MEEKLGDKYEVQIFPNELLGSAQKAIELTQTGAIDFVVAGTANLETFADVYEIFSMPYLFDSEEVYKSVMQDTEYMENVYASTDEAGFRVVTWYNAGTRNFYGIWSGSGANGIWRGIYGYPAGRHRRCRE